MRNLLLVAGLLVPLAACSTSRPQRPWTPYGEPYGQQQVQAQPMRPSYSMPWAVPATPAPGSWGATPPAAPAAAAGGATPGQWAADRDRCLSDSGSKADCEAALAGAARSWNAAPGAAVREPAVHDVYRRACERKAKLQGCGVFKSTAVDEGDRANVELLMLCESGRSEACEDVSTRKAPLVAWHSTLKAAACKNGQTALCKSHRQCRPATQWGCAPATSPAGAGEVCGCVPRTCEGPTTVTASPRKWPDGSARGDFTCGAR